MHGQHEAGALDLTSAALGIALLVFVLAHLLAVRGCAERGRGWPGWRTACALLGAALAWVAVGPLRLRGMHDFEVHMWAHLLLGMLAPLLLAVSAPVTLALRALPVRQARRLSRLLRTRWAALVTHPVVAATLDVGGLWLLYTTPLYAAMHTHPVLGLVVHAHVLLAGWVFSVAILHTEPMTHPASHRLRAVVLVVFMALHGILSKYLYAHPPQGVDAEAARRGAELMFYGGDYVDLVLVALFCLDWYRRTAPTTTTTVTAR